MDGRGEERGGRMGRERKVDRRYGRERTGEGASLTLMALTSNGFSNVCGARGGTVT